MLLRVGDFGLCQKVPDVRHFQYTRDVRKAPYTPGGTEGYLPPEVHLLPFPPFLPSSHTSLTFLLIIPAVLLTSLIEGRRA
jgi:hypothetical protein